LASGPPRDGAAAGDGPAPGPANRRRRPRPPQQPSVANVLRAPPGPGGQGRQRPPARHAVATRAETRTASTPFPVVHTHGTHGTARRRTSRASPRQWSRPRHAPTHCQTSHGTRHTTHGTRHTAHDTRHTTRQGKRMHITLPRCCCCLCWPIACEAGNHGVLPTACFFERPLGGEGAVCRTCTSLRGDEEEGRPAVAAPWVVADLLLLLVPAVSSPPPLPLCYHQQQQQQP
jgi:hypothetical protein